MSEEAKQIRGLVLTVRPGEIISLGENVRICITRVKGNQVRICFDCPRETKIEHDSQRRRRERQEADDKKLP